jgi:hypothetical protein
LIVSLRPCRVPHRQPVVRPDRQIELPIAASAEPATTTLPPE